MESVSFALPAAAEWTRGGGDVKKEEGKDGAGTAVFEGSAAEEKAKQEAADREQEQREYVIELPQRHQRRLAALSRLQQQQQQEEQQQGEKGGAVEYRPGLQFVTQKKLGVGKVVGGGAAPDEAPLLSGASAAAALSREAEAAQFKQQLQAMGEMTLERYEAMPVEEFGKAALRGMDWKEGAPIGLSNRQVVKPIEYVARPKGLGIGAEPADLAKLQEQKKAAEEEARAAAEGKSAKKRRKILRPGQEKEKPVMVTKSGKHYRTVDETLVAKKVLDWTAGSLLGIVSGEHKGLMGTIEKRVNRDELLVKLGNGATVVLEQRDAVLLDPLLLQQGEKGKEKIRHVMREARAKQERESGADAENSEDSQRSKKATRKKKKKKKKKEKKEKGKSKRQRTWLMPGIVVRCVSKSFQSGQLYQQKLVVVDLPSPTQASCVLFTDGRKMVDGVPQEVLETALPKAGGLVVVVRGELRGEVGVLKQRNSKKNRAVVQLNSDLALHTLRMDDVAQWRAESA